MENENKSLKSRVGLVENENEDLKNTNDSLLNRVDLVEIENNNLKEEIKDVDDKYNILNEELKINKKKMEKMEERLEKIYLKPEFQRYNFISNFINVTYDSNQTRNFENTKKIL